MSPATRPTDRLISRVYDELHALASACLKGERSDHSLVPTALVHEAYLRLVECEDAEWTGAAHFHLIAARTIRRILVDHARARRTTKRGGGRERITISGLAATEGAADVDVLDLEAGLDALARLSPRMCRVVELKYFAGLTIEETARALGVGTTTVEDEWAFARSWLRRRLDSAAPRP